MRAAVIALGLLGCGVAAAEVRLSLMTTIYTDATGVGLSVPEDVASEGKTVVVADTGNGRLVFYDVGEDVLVSRPPVAWPEVPQPIGVALGPDGRLLVLDGRARRVARIGTAGNFEGWVEPPAAGEMTPRAVTIAADGSAYILDVRSPRVLVLDPRGELLRSITFSEPPRAPADLAVTPSGDVYVVDGLAGMLFVAPADSTTATVRARFGADTVGLAHALALDSLGRSFVVDRGRGRIAIFERDGTSAGTILGAGWNAGELRYPGGIAIDSRGNVFVADRENHRVQVFRVAR